MILNKLEQIHEWFTCYEIGGLCLSPTVPHINQLSQLSRAFQPLRSLKSFKLALIVRPACSSIKPVRWPRIVYSVNFLTFPSTFTVHAMAAIDSVVAQLITAPKQAAQIKDIPVGSIVNTAHPSSSYSLRHRTTPTLFSTFSMALAHQAKEVGWSSNLSRDRSSWLGRLPCVCDERRQLPRLVDRYVLCESECPHAELPSCTGNGAMTIGVLGPCALNSPHTHPRATELQLVTSGGPIQTALIQENGVRTVQNTMSVGSAAIFPYVASQILPWGKL